MTIFKSATVARGFALGLGGALALLAGTFPASAALPVGEKAPDFTLKAALAGKPMTFSLRQALKKGPVVLYFFPAAFTKGCTLEAHAFAEATDDFNKMHATVIGVTAGNIDRVAEFSSVECRNKFAVAADPDAKIAGEYKNQLQFNGKVISDRTSYVIAPDGKILLSYTNPNPEEHITKAMEAVKAWRAKHA
ncbi:MAG: peroxiredoxin [Sphingomonadales bacterium]|nr:peroxiredoxin [Sphingomonadales bacterium]MDE2169895.1 peroxiredoxin [Sphingomonadales bacterium]